MNIYELDKLIKSLKNQNDPDLQSLIDFYLKQRKILLDKIYDALDENIEDMINSNLSSAEWKKQQEVA
jgi:hypothetical protein